MKQLTLAIVLMLCGCASKSYKSSMLADGKTWKIILPTTTCSIDSVHDCYVQLSLNTSDYATSMCGNERYRLFACNTKESTVLARVKVKGECYLQCNLNP